MIKLNNLVPTNLASEKEKFFASNFTYNPQFTYTNTKEISKKELEKYGKPKLWYLFLAKRVLKKYLNNPEFRKFGPDHRFLSQEELRQAIEERLTQYNLDQVYQLVFSANFVSRIALNNKDKIIKIRLPVTIYKDEIKAVLNHEIDTHALRQLNYEQQPWFGQKKQLSFKPYLRTEEGLAAINELMATSHALNFKSAANYIAVDIALKKDFLAVFNFFYSIWGESDRAWIWTVKKKRGSTDTSQRGAYTKDLVYFEGFVQVLKYLSKHPDNLNKLYYGKIGYRDIGKVEKLGVNKNLLLPRLLVKHPFAYQQAFAKMIKQNLS